MVGFSYSFVFVSFSVVIIIIIIMMDRAQVEASLIDTRQKASFLAAVTRHSGELSLIHISEPTRPY